MCPPPPSRSRAFVALVLLVPVPTLGAMAGMVFEPTRGTPLGQALYVASKIWILILPLAWWLIIEQRRISFSPPRQGGLLLGAALGFAIGSAIILAYVIFAHQWIDADQLRSAVERNGFGTPVRFLVLVVPLALINSLLEEYVWRWFVFSRCEIVLGRVAAVIAAALFFTLHHIVVLHAQTNWRITLLGSAGVFIGGCAWSWCYLRYRSIWPGYVSHVITDLAVFAVGWHVIFG